MILKKGEQGVTLLELMLVLAIGSLLLVLGLRMVQTFNLDRDAMQVQANVDSLFQGLANYYRANCIQYKSSSTVVSKAGTLDPNAVPTPPTNPFSLAISDLNSAGFLSRWPFPTNALVDETAPASTYVVQFNLSTTTRTQCITGTTSSCTATANIGTIYMWKAQVAVHMKNAAAYKGVLAADCTSSYSGGIVTPCTATSTGDYLVWERLPSFAAPEQMTSLWPSMPLVEQFTQMYTTYPMTSLTSGYVTNQYFLCNG